MKIRKLFLASILSFSMAGQCISPVFAQEENNDEEVEEVVEETLEQEVPEVLEDVEEVEAPEESEEETEDNQEDNEAIEEEIEQENVASGTWGTNVNWALSDAGVLTIYGTGKMDCTIHHSDYPWYTFRDSIVKVVIQEGVTSIGMGAFQSDYSKLEEVSIPNSMYNIEDNAFDGCIRLKKISIPGSVVNIGWSAFRNCKSLSSVTISDGVERIADFAFGHCYALNSIYIPQSVNEIGRGVFNGCYNITSVSVDAKNKIYECPSGYNVIIEKSTHKLVCGFTNSIIPYGVTTIGDRAFFYLKNLSIVIPSSVITIEEFAFACSTINSISIPTSVTKMNENVFDDVQVIKVYYSGSENQFNSIDFESDTDKSKLTGNITYNQSGQCGDGVWWNIVGSQIIISGISGNTMYDYDAKGAPWYGCCDYVTIVNIGSGITNIGNNAFRNFTKLTTVTLPSSLTKIGEYAFCNCSKLETIALPENLTTIDYFAFCWCSSLKSINIPKNVTSIVNNPFGGCNNLATITVDSENTVYDSRANCNGIVKKSTGALIVGNKYTKLVNSFIIGRITRIGSYAFLDCDFASYNIPKNISVIETYAFVSCGSLSQVSFSNKINTLQTNAFYSCPKLKNIYLYKNTAPDTYFDSSYNKMYFDKTVIFLGHQLSLSGDLKMTYYVAISDDLLDDSTTHMEFTLPNGTKKTENVKSYTENGGYSFTVTVSAKEMTDTITAKIISGGTVLKTETYSIQQYANSILNDTTGTYDASTKNIVKTMLTYGYYTQKYFNYHTSNLPTGINTLTPYDFGNWKYIVAQDKSSVKFVGARLVLESIPKIKLYFNGNSTFTVSLPTTTSYSVTKEGKYTVMTIDITDYCNTSYLISADDGKFGLLYHPYCYGYAANQGTNQNLKNLMSAFYAYYNLFIN